MGAFAGAYLFLFYNQLATRPGVPILQDIPLKDQRETMERPFFSLQKRKRVKPISDALRP